LLAAYRRDDWSPAELAALGQHLAGCADCRRAEAVFRQVGEGVRQLPSITPPASLRANVWAAIQADQTQRATSAELGAERNAERVATLDAERRATASPERAPAVVRHDAALVALTTGDTQPGLPALRRTDRARIVDGRGPLVFGARTAIAVAAVLVLSLVAARLVPLMGRQASGAAAAIATALPFALPGGAVPRVDHYAVNASSGRVTQAMASDAWLAYVTADASGHSMLFAEDRASHRAIALLPSAAAGAITLRAVSDRWVVWLAGDGVASSPWTLWAAALPADRRVGVAGQPVALLGASAAASTAPGVLGGVSLSGDTVLAAASTPGGAATITRLDLSITGAAPVARVVARAQATGHLLTNPSLTAGYYYWAEVWYDTATGLHSRIWRADSAGRVREVTTPRDAYAPHMADHSLVWVQPTSTIAADLQAAANQLDGTVLGQVSGDIHVRNLTSGHDTDVAAASTAGSVEAAGSLILWRAGGHVQTYDLDRGGPSLVEGQVGSASYAAANATSLAWGARGSNVISVYDAG
jgi:hypothetical protein